MRLRPGVLASFRILLGAVVGLTPAAAAGAAPPGAAPPGAPPPGAPPAFPGLPPAARSADDFPERLETCIRKARDYLFSLQSDKILMLVGENTSVQIDQANPALDRIEVEGRWEDVAIDVRTRTVKIKGRVFNNVYLIMPPGWFGPPEWVKGEPYDCVNAAGHSALIACALLASGVHPVQDKRMKAAVDCLVNLHMRELGFIPGKGQVGGSRGFAPPPRPGTVGPGFLDAGPMGSYAIGLRAQAIEHALRSIRQGPARSALVKTLQRDARMLAGGYGKDGGYTYVMQDPAGAAARGGFMDWSMSRTQYGLLGLWACSQVKEAELPAAVWEHFNKFFLEQQTPDGGWGYTGRSPPTPLMTAAGIASLFVVMDQVHTRSRGYRGPDVTPFERNPALFRTMTALDRSLEYFGRNIRLDAAGYNMYGIERVGVASGYKYFGTHDWFREGAEAVMASQQPDGSLGAGRGPIGTVPSRDTAWNLLFLVHGSAPVLINKLKYGPPGDWQWNNYPRDAAMLAKWHERAFEQEVNWQIVPLDTGKDEDFLDAPVLYVSGFKPFAFSPAEVDKLRRYVERGGTLLFVNCGGALGRRFGDSVTALAAQLYPPDKHPDYRLADLPANHPLREGETPAETRALAKLNIRHARNGHRTFLIHVADDVNHLWHSNRWATRPDVFTLVANIKRYALDRGPLPPKIRPDPEAGRPATPGKPIRVAVVRYESKGGPKVADKTVIAAGDWDAVPAAWQAFAPWFARSGGGEVKETRGVALTDDLSGYDLLHVSGHYAFALTDAEIAALKKFVAAGGTAFFEQVGGRDADGERAFYDTAIELFRKLYPDNRPAVLPAGHDLFSGKLPGGETGADCKAVTYSRAIALKRGDLRSPWLQAVVLGGRPAVLISQYDVSCALAGISFADREGYSAKSARDLAGNLLRSARAAR